MKHTFKLPGVTLSQNELDGKHWQVKHQEKVTWHENVWVYAQRCPYIPSKAHVHFVRVSKRIIDPLNVFAGLKWCLDAFVNMGWLTGDGYEDVTVSADQRKCTPKEDPHMIVEITYED